ncbi:MAG: hypothetical protein ACK44A_05450 [Roseateles sp.]
MNCQHQVPANLLMCNDHWRQVPEKLRGEVWLQYRRVKANPDARDARQAHQRAVQAAIDAVHTKQVKAKARRDAGTKPLF